MWTTKRTTLNFNGSFYEQIDGVGMGSPIAPAFADIFMKYVIEKTKKLNVQPDEFFRYVWTIALQYFQILKVLCHFIEN